MIEYLALFEKTRLHSPLKEKDVAVERSPWCNSQNETSTLTSSRFAKTGSFLRLRFLEAASLPSDAMRSFLLASSDSAFINISERQLWRESRGGKRAERQRNIDETLILAFKIDLQINGPALLNFQKLP